MSKLPRLQTLTWRNLASQSPGRHRMSATSSALALRAGQCRWIPAGCEMDWSDTGPCASAMGLRDLVGLALCPGDGIVPGRFVKMRFCGCPMSAFSCSWACRRTHKACPHTQGANPVSSYGLADLARLGARTSLAVARACSLARAVGIRQERSAHEPVSCCSLCVALLAVADGVADSFALTCFRKSGERRTKRVFRPHLPVYKAGECLYKAL